MVISLDIIIGELIDIQNQGLCLFHARPLASSGFRSPENRKLVLRSIAGRHESTAIKRPAFFPLRRDRNSDKFNRRVAQGESATLTR